MGTRESRKKQLAFLYTESLKDTTERPLMLRLARYSGGGLKPLVLECPKGSVIRRRKVTWKDRKGNKIQREMSHMFLPTKYAASLWFPGNYRDYSYAQNKYDHMKVYGNYRKLVGAIVAIAYTVIVLYIDPAQGGQLNFYDNPWIMLCVGLLAMGYLNLKQTKKNTDMDYLPLTIQEQREDGDKRIVYYCIPSDLPVAKTMEMMGGVIPQDWYKQQTELLTALKEYSGEKELYMDKALMKSEIEKAHLVNEIDVSGGLSSRANRVMEVGRIKAWQTAGVGLTILSIGLMVLYALSQGWING